MFPGMEGCGMMCDQSFKNLMKRINPIRDHRSFLSAATLFWLEACSGIHVSLLEELDLSSAPSVTFDSIRMGSRHTSVPETRSIHRPRSKRPRGAVSGRDEATKQDHRAHHDDYAEDDKQCVDGDREQESSGSAHNHHSHHAFQELMSLRQELIRNQKTFQKTLLSYVSDEMAKMRMELRRQMSRNGQSDMSSPNVELARVCDEIWRHGQQEIISFVASMEHIREQM
jgi:hypothetical protein